MLLNASSVEMVLSQLPEVSQDIEDEDAIVLKELCQDHCITTIPLKEKPTAHCL